MRPGVRRVPLQQLADRLLRGFRVVAAPLDQQPAQPQVRGHAGRRGRHVLDRARPPFEPRAQLRHGPVRVQRQRLGRGHGAPRREARAQVARPARQPRLGAAEVALPRAPAAAASSSRARASRPKRPWASATNSSRSPSPAWRARAASSASRPSSIPAQVLEPAEQAPGRGRGPVAETGHALAQEGHGLGGAVEALRRGDVAVDVGLVVDVAAGREPVELEGLLVAGRGRRRAPREPRAPARPRGESARSARAAAAPRAPAGRPRPAPPRAGWRRPGRTRAARPAAKAARSRRRGGRAAAAGSRAAARRARCPGSGRRERRRPAAAPRGRRRRRRAARP